MFNLFKEKPHVHNWEVCYPPGCVALRCNKIGCPLGDSYMERQVYIAGFPLWIEWNRANSLIEHLRKSNCQVVDDVANLVEITFDYTKEELRRRENMYKLAEEVRKFRDKHL